MPEIIKQNNKEIRRVARSVKIDQWTPGIRPTWNVSQVKSALYSHQTGDFSQSALLVEAMFADDELPTALNNAVNEIAGAPFSLDPIQDPRTGEPIEASQNQVDLLNPYWSDSYPDHEIAAMMRWFFMLGVAIGTIDWDTSVTPWQPKLRTLHPQFLWWDDSCINPQTGLYGTFRYNARDGSSQMVTPGDGKWVLLSDGRESWMRCSVRALATTWLVKQYTWRDWARYNERHGLPIVKAKVPFVAEADDKINFFNDIKTLGTETTAMLPIGLDTENPEIGFDLELLEAKDQSYDSFENAIARCDRKFQIHFQGSNTNELIGTAGSRSTSESGRSIQAQTAAQRERRITTDLRDQLVKPFMRFNIPNFNPDLTPWPHYNVEGEEDTLRRSESIKSLADALKSMSEAGYVVTNIDEEASKLGLKIKKVETTETPEEPDNEELTALANDNPVNPADVGRSDGFVNGQKYLDDLTDQLTTEADALEAVTAERMLEIINDADTPEALEEALKQEVADVSPVQMAALFEKAILLSQLAGRYAVVEDI